MRHASYYKFLLLSFPANFYFSNATAARLPVKKSIQQAKNDQSKNAREKDKLESQIEEDEKELETKNKEIETVRVRISSVTSISP